MAAPASEDLRELERDLEIAADRGEPVTRAAVQEQFGLSAAAADAMLSVLRENGKAVEIAPGEWMGPTLDELARGPQEPQEQRVVVSVPDEDKNGASGELARPARFEALRAGVGVLTNEPTVRLTRSIAEALDAEALGKLVRAGLGDVEDGETFVLEVTP